jgi:succinate dehydrogenase / fumarate reductase iron-sulfur subunit
MTAKASDVVVAVRRQDGPTERATRRWERFAIDKARARTVADLLDAIAADPRTVQGDITSPVVWDAACTWPSCGVCTMLIDGAARPACGTLVDEVVRRGVVVLEPLAKFPLIRDLMVDRQSLRERATRAASFAEPRAEDRAEGRAAAIERWALMRCSECGACLEACPEAAPARRYVGPAAIALGLEASLRRPDHAPKRLVAMLAKGGIDDCGLAQNCVAVCPERVPLDDALFATARAVSRHLFGRLWRRR